MLGVTPAHCKMMHVRQLTGDMVSGNEVTQTVKLLIFYVIFSYYLLYLGDDNMTDNT